MPWDRKSYHREYMRTWRAQRKQRREEEAARAARDKTHVACDAEIRRLKRLLEQHQIKY